MKRDVFDAVKLFYSWYYMYTAIMPGMQKISWLIVYLTG